MHQRVCTEALCIGLLSLLDVSCGFVYSLADGEGGFVLVLVPCWLRVGLPGITKGGGKESVWLVKARSVPRPGSWRSPCTSCGSAPEVAEACGRSGAGRTAVEGRVLLLKAWRPKPQQHHGLCVLLLPSGPSYPCLGAAKSSPCHSTRAGHQSPHKPRCSVTALPVLGPCKANRCPRCWLLLLQLSLKGRFLSASSSLWAGWGV